LLTFSAQKPGLERIDDEFEIEICIPKGFPRQLPTVKEVGGRIPDTFHKNSGGILCLGTPTAQMLQLHKSQTVPGFVESCVIPYLYGFVYREKFGSMPFDEQEHGEIGLLDDFREMFAVKTNSGAIAMVRLCSLKKRVANKQPCPCGSGKRVGKCHNRKLNVLRKKLGRQWFLTEYKSMIRGIKRHLRWRDQFEILGGITGVIHQSGSFAVAS
jgi:hypothetical protein